MTLKIRLSGAMRHPTCLLAAAAAALSLAAVAPARAEVCQAVASVSFSVVGSNPRYASVRITNLSTTQTLTVETVTVGPLPAGLTPTAASLSNIKASAGRSYAFAFANVPLTDTSTTASSFRPFYDAPAQSTGEVGIQGCTLQ